MIKCYLYNINSRIYDGSKFGGLAIILILIGCGNHKLFKSGKSIRKNNSSCKELRSDVFSKSAA